jgi:hypothetical protein
MYFHTYSRYEEEGALGKSLKREQSIRGQARMDRGAIYSYRYQRSGN